MPKCQSCQADDCGHVGFTILLEQKYDNEGSILDWFRSCMIGVHTRQMIYENNLLYCAFLFSSFTDSFAL